MDNLDENLFVKGCFHDRYAAGERADYSEPSTSLPKVPKGTAMTIETGYVAAMKKFGTGTRLAVETAIAASKSPGTW